MPVPIGQELSANPILFLSAVDGDQRGPRSGLPKEFRISTGLRPPQTALQVGVTHHSRDQMIGIPGCRIDSRRDDFKTRIYTGIRDKSTPRLLSIPPEAKSQSQGHMQGKMTRRSSGKHSVVCLLRAAARKSYSFFRFSTFLFKTSQSIRQFKFCSTRRPSAARPVMETNCSLRFSPGST